MKVEKKYTAIMIGTSTINDTVKVSFEYGDIEGSYYDEQRPKEEFDTEEEAIKWAYEYSKYSRWVIVPLITFQN